jgi:putative transposon-encoded protein
MEVIAHAHEVIDRVCRPIGTGAHVILPKTWDGKKVKILLLEPIKEVNKE